MKTDEQLRAEGRAEVLNIIAALPVEGGLDHCIDAVPGEPAGVTEFRWNRLELAKLLKVPEGCR